MRASLTLGLALGASVLAVAACNPATPTEAPKHPSASSAQSWQEDSLPDPLYRWVKRYGADLQNWSRRTIEGHTGCWAAVADTTLVMCPDGFSTTS